MIAHTLLCYSLYSRECWEHEWPLGSAGTDLVRCGDLGALLGLRQEYSAAFGRASRANHQGAAPPPHAAALSSAADSARLHAVVHGTEAAPTARAAASGSGHGPAEAVEERGLRGHHVTAPAASGKDAAPSPPRPPPSRHHRCRHRGLRRRHRRSSCRRQHRTRVLTAITRAPIGPCKTRSYTT